MNKQHTIAALLVGLAAAACDDESPTNSRDTMDIDARVESVIEQMTTAEKLEQMHGLQLAPIDGLYYTPENTRLKIPSFKMVDGPRGVRAAGRATTFPVGMARGATWDPELEHRVGSVMGLETLAKGGNVLLAPAINVLRHPSWGRAQETYGEEPMHIGSMGVSFIQGAQEHVIADAKHFAANSIEDTRFHVDVQMDERTLREVYLPHFRRAVQEAKVGSVMSAYNIVNGSYCGENHHLLRDILKGEWGFDGFVVSDWIFGTRSTVESVIAGLDIEMPMPQYFGDKLTVAVDDGQVDSSLIDESVRRILTTKFRFGLDAPKTPDADVVESDAHKATALEVAQKSIVLLKNEGVLPFDADASGSLVVVGTLAAVANLGDTGSSDARPTMTVTPLQGLLDHGSSKTIEHIDANTLTDADNAKVRDADAVVIVAGLTSRDEGELLPTGGGDRPNIALSAEHQALIQAVTALNPNTVVVVEGGSAITMDPWLADAKAVLMAWYAGQEGGTAIAQILFGDVNPSGKLPITFPKSTEQLPEFDNESEIVTYGYYHGYRHIDREGHEPLFPFGFGLSYTTFEYKVVSLDNAEIDGAGKLQASVEITNTGDVAGVEVVQLYVSFENSGVDRPIRELEAFRRVHLEPGQTRTVTLELSIADLAYFDTVANEWTVESMKYGVHVGASSRDLPISAEFTVR